MGSIILDQTIIGRGSFVAAGSMVTGNKTIEPYSSVRGSPAQVIRQVNDKEKAICKASVEHYLNVVNLYQSARD